MSVEAASSRCVSRCRRWTRPSRRPATKKSAVPSERLAHDLGRRRRDEAVVEHEEVAEPDGDREAAELEEEHGGEDEREEEERPQVRRSDDGDEGRDGEQRRDEGSAAPQGEASAVAVARDVRRWGHAAPSQPCLATPTTGAVAFLPPGASAPVATSGYSPVAGAGARARANVNEVAGRRRKRPPAVRLESGRDPADPPHQRRRHRRPRHRRAAPRPRRSR